MSLLIATAVAVSPAPPRDCAPARLDACDTTNSLIWSRAFTRDLHAFLGDGTASYLNRNRPVFDQAQEVLGGPPDDPVRLADRSWMFTACRAHSCAEKGAVVLTPAGRIVAVGILHFGCGASTNPRRSCTGIPRLALYLRGAAPSSTAIARTEIETWARGNEPTLAGVDVTMR
ncbi:hypothetical protein [Sphingomonas sp.]|uniref:hypothetical protein n=1 Tax=Sphingomonas sp. TaxID=28214 RepID=UPI0035C7DD72